MSLFKLLLSRINSQPDIALKRLVGLLLRGLPGGIGKLKQLLRDNQSLKGTILMNQHVMLQEGIPPLTPLWAAFKSKPSLSEDILIEIAAILIQRGASLEWSTSEMGEIKSHYAVALHQKQFFLASFMIHQEIVMGKPVAVSDDVLTTVVSQALAVRLSPDQNSIEGETIDYSMSVAVMLLQLIDENKMEKMRLGGKPVVHFMLHSFAQQVELLARLKYNDIVSQIPDSQGIDTQLLCSEAVASLLKRLWQLLRIAIERGASVVSVSEARFPCCPQASLCDHTVIWQGIKSFATAWVGQWRPQLTVLYHPTFRRAVTTMVIISQKRGFTVYNEASRSKHTYFLGKELSEKIIGYMAEDQSAWVKTL